jgi:hypothetical protein
MGRLNRENLSVLNQNDGAAVIKLWAQLFASQPAGWGLSSSRGGGKDGRRLGHDSRLDCMPARRLTA